MNLHPIVVHLPISFLAVYAVLEIITAWYRRQARAFLAIKTFLLGIGWGSALLAIQTGEVAPGGPYAVREMHESFAGATVWIFGILALVYLGYMVWVEDVFGWGTRLQRLGDARPALARIMMRKKAAFAWLFRQRWLLVLGALAGLVAITVTGALGGYMVHGAGIDPLSDWIIKVLGLSA